jgi:hypothetical protein
MLSRGKNRLARDFGHRSIRRKQIVPFVIPRAPILAIASLAAGFVGGAAAFAPGDCGHESNVFGRVSFLGPSKLQRDELHSGSTAVLRATVMGRFARTDDRIHDPT